MRPNILLYGIGNPGRTDDGLGIHVVSEIEQWLVKQDYTSVITECNYQLNIEDANTISYYDIVIFIDASMEEHVDEYIITPVSPSEKTTYTLHHAPPELILHLCDSLYNRKPDAYLMHIKGFKWDLAEGLTEEAKHNGDKALKILKDIIIDPKKMSISYSSAS